MKWLFPDVPAEHPAMGSMLMNMAANFLGLANAATPLGLRAMKDLETLNPVRHATMRCVRSSPSTQFNSTTP
jgi:spore maturation protein SpmA